MKKWYTTKPTVISYGAVEISNLKNQISHKIKKESALFYGRLDEQTGIVTYVKAVEILKKKYPKFSFHVIGDGKYEKLIKKKTTLQGFQKHPEKFLKDYHFAFLSRYLSMLEAFAAKRLVFAVYDNPVKEDYLRMTPFAKWIIITGDENELAEKINYYLRHPEEEKKLIENAYDWVVKQNWEKMAGIYVSLWHDKNQHSA